MKSILRKYREHLADEEWVDHSLYANTPLVKNKKTVEKLIAYLTQWCSTKLGKRNFIPIIEYKNDDPQLRETESLGTYDGKVIRIRMVGHQKLEYFCMTFIHEWVHYLQSSAWYTRHNKVYSYENHPYEIEAYHIANLYLENFIEWMKVTDKRFFNKLQLYCYDTQSRSS